MKWTASFWPPVYSSAHQTAKDMGISLDMERFEPQESSEIMYVKMGARIRNFCEDGVDGVLVSIPNEILLESIRFCLSLRVPVVAVNSGADWARELGILFIGQSEYNAGYNAGKRLLEQGMREGYCLNHSPDTQSLVERCRGFIAALDEVTDDVAVFKGSIAVSGGDRAKYILSVEEGVKDLSPTDFNGDWEGLGFLSFSRSNFMYALEVVDLHPKALLGNFDTSEEMNEPLLDGRLQFGIDQQPLLQGMLPVYLLTYAAYTGQSLVNDEVETGPHFLVTPPSPDQIICEETMYPVCPDVPTENMNLLSSELVAVGYFFVAFTLFAAGVCLVWTLFFWSKSELVRISQPPCLLALIAGVSLSSLSIVFMSVETEYPNIKSPYTGQLTDESNGDIGTVNAACMAAPWLYCIGSVIVFGALFSRIWKIQKIFKAGERFRRIKVRLVDVLPYVMVMVTVVLGLLIAWQVADPFVWTREVELANLDGLALESTGECTSDSGWYYFLSLLCFQVVYLLYALVLCWQTKEIPGDFSEGNYVSLCVICIFQVSVLAIPIGIMVRGDTDTFYFVRACTVFLQNITVLGLMFAPKVRFRH